MFERFTERSRKVIVLALEEARRFGHGYIGTEHLLLGLLCEDENVESDALFGGASAETLLPMGITPGRVRGEVERIVGHGEEGGAEKVPFTSHSRNALDRALHEAARLGDGEVAPEHLLLGVLREPEGVAERIFSNLGVEPEKIRREVLLRIGKEPGEEMEFRTSSEPFRALTLLSGSHSSPRKSLRLVVKLEYTYSMDMDGVPPYSLAHRELRRFVANVLHRGEFLSLEEAASVAGKRMLSEFPALSETSVSLTDRRLSGATISGTFRR